MYVCIYIFTSRILTLKQQVMMRARRIKTRVPLVLVSGVSGLHALNTTPHCGHTGTGDTGLRTQSVQISMCNGTPFCELVYFSVLAGVWGCEVSCGGHHRLRGKTTTGSALDGAVFDITQILAYLVHNMSRSQVYLGFGHFGWIPSFFGQ